MHRLRGQVLGLVGLGRVGEAVAARADAFGLRCIAADPYRDGDELRALGIEPVDLDDLMAGASIVSLHAPLTESTRGIVDERLLALMAPGGILINTARGGLVDDSALLGALRDGTLAGAGLDVLGSEPPTPAERELLALEQVVVTPHAGFLSEESLLSVQTQAADEVRRVLVGEPARHSVNTDAVGSAQK